VIAFAGVMALRMRTKRGMVGVFSVGALLAVVACGGVYEQGPSDTGSRPDSAGTGGSATDQVPHGSDVGTAGTRLVSLDGRVGGGVGTGGTTLLEPAGGSTGETGGIGGSGRLPSRGPFDDKGVSVPPQHCNGGGVGTCCTYQFCLDLDDTLKVFGESSAGGAGGAPPDIADACHTADKRVGFCGEITTLPTVQDGQCCFAVYSGDCC